jgi:hypothetical protein
MFWFDADDDGFGDPASTPVSACRAPDGHVDNDDDCADDDSSVSPGATETWYDGVDQDCDGLSDYDQDLDGVDAADQGGMDCDDEDATVYPGAVELDDGVDNDCDTYRDEDVVRPGDLVITEVFVEPVSGTPGDGEWLELINVSSTHADLALVRIEVDGVGALLSETSLPMPPQAVWMVCANPSPAANGGVDPCGSVLALPTGARSFVLEGPEGVVDEVDARGWSFTPGRSLELGDAHLDADDNDVESAWCPAVSLFGDAAGDRGTPGSFLPPCP